MSHSIMAIPALNDNYIWAIIHDSSKQVVVVDPGDATPVIETLSQHSLSLSAILITHHHWDHTNGIKACLAHSSVPIYAPKNDKVNFASILLEEGDQVNIPEMDLSLAVIDIPGHTIGHIAYHGQGWLFSGDALFAGGCGRIFEGNAEMFYHSLQKLTVLDPTTRVYCGHEYTINNLRFAHFVEPDNLHIMEQIKVAIEKQATHLPTLPSTIGIENLVNPFLRCDSPTIINTLKKHNPIQFEDPIAVFAALRALKNTKNVW